MTINELIADKVFNNLDEYYAVPSYLTDMNTAWSVVEMLNKQGVWLHELGNDTENNWRCIFADGKGHEIAWHQGIASTAQMAICLAALQYARVSQNEIDQAQENGK